MSNDWYFGIGGGFPHERLNVTCSSCTLWASSYDIPLPSAQTGPLVSPGFPMREAQTARMYSTLQAHVSKYTHFASLFLSLPPSLIYLVQVLWVEQLHRLVLEPVL